VSPYALLFMAELSPLTMASGVYGLVFSARAIAAGRLDFEAPEKVHLLKAVLPLTSQALKAWMLLAALAELASFAIVSKVFHPLLPSLCYILAAMLNKACAAEDEESIFLGSLLALQSCFFGYHTRVLGLAPSRSNQGVGWPEGLFSVARLGAWLAACLWLSLPQGFVPLADLGRPMGPAVLTKEFIEPTQEVVTALRHCIQHFSSQGIQHCSLPGNLQSFRAVLLLLAATGLPIHCTLVFVNVILNPHWRDEQNEGLLLELKAKKEEVEAWAISKAQHNEDATVLELACPMALSELEREGSSSSLL